MKINISILLSVILSCFSLSSAFAAREVTLSTQKIKEAVHWMPEKIEVKAGETIKFIAKHNLEGGFDFHGFLIPVLKISEQVNRNKPLTLEVKIPSDLKPGEYPIGCQFHAKHVGAILKVVPK